MPQVASETDTDTFASTIWSRKLHAFRISATISRKLIKANNNYSDGITRNELKVFHQQEKRHGWVMVGKAGANEHSLAHSMWAGGCVCACWGVAN